MSICKTTRTEFEKKGPKSMKYSLCTISFRHQLISFTDIVQFAYKNGFEGIELWGIHAQNLYTQEREVTEKQIDFYEITI